MHFFDQKNFRTASSYVCKVKAGGFLICDFSAIYGTLKTDTNILKQAEPLPHLKSDFPSIAGVMNWEVHNRLLIITE